MNKTVDVRGDEKQIVLVGVKSCQVMHVPDFRANGGNLPCKETDPFQYKIHSSHDKTDTATQSHSAEIALEKVVSVGMHAYNIKGCFLVINFYKHTHTHTMKKVSETNIFLLYPLGLFHCKHTDKNSAFL